VTLRILAGLSLLCGLPTLLAYVHRVGKGPFVSAPARHLRAMKDRTAAPSSFEPLAVADLASLPRRRPLEEYAHLERRGVGVEGYVWRMIRSTDGDIHLSLAPRPPAEGAGPREPSAIAEITPAWQRGSAWTYERLAARFRPRFGTVTPWEGGPRRVRLSGWLLYDYPNEGVKPGDVRALPAAPAWEIHPVTRIELWDDSSAAFVEYPR
jgi:hypothetical protein